MQGKASYGGIFLYRRVLRQRAMPSKMASANLTLGMVQIPLGIAKAASEDAPDLKTLCECGGSLGPMSDDDGNKVACKECNEGYSWYNSAPAKGFELGDEMIRLDADEVSGARKDAPVGLGNVEKATPVKRVLLHYAVEGNYYLLPEDEFRDQYGVLVGVLNEQDLALLTYLQLRSKTRRFAVVSEGGVLMALQLQDKKAIPDLDYGTDEVMEEQAAGMLEGMVEDDPTLPDVEGQGIKEMVREKVGKSEPEEDTIAAEV